MKYLNIMLTSTMLTMFTLISVYTLAADHLTDEYGRTGKTEEVKSKDDRDRIELASEAYTAYVYVENRYAYTTSVYINNIYVGWLRPGAYDWFSAPSGCINVTAYWSNGFYNYWNPCISPGGSYRCYTSY